jgi:hypothetical protein
MSGNTVPFVEYKGFLKAALDFGIDVESGIKELIDNSIDARATTVRVILDMKHNVQDQTTGIVHERVMRIFVVDDGHGIPATVEDAGTGIEYPGLPFVLSFGGREANIFTAEHQRRIGRFGWGLSATVACLAKERGQGVVWTKQAQDATWRSCRFHYASLLENEMNLEQTAASPPMIPPDFTTGTIVMIDVVDPDRVRLGPLQQAIVKYAGRTYRHHLANNATTITVTTLKEGKWDNAEHTTVQLSDPLCLMPESRQVKLFGEAKRYDRVTLRFNGTDDEHELESFGVIIDPLTDKPAEVHIDVSLTSRAKVHHALFSVDTTGDARAKDRQLESHGFGMKGQGFSFLRDGREIVQNRSQGLYGRHTQYNYMHGDIHFPSCLDHLFGIQQNKSRFGAVESLQTVLQSAIEGILIQVQQDVKAQAGEETESKTIINLRAAETNIRQAAPHLPTPSYTAEQKVAGDAARTEAKQRMADRIKVEFDDRMESAALKAQAEEKDELWLEEELHRILSEMTDLMQQNDARWEGRSPVRFLPWKEAPEGSSAMYEVEIRGDEARVYLRDDHPAVAQLHAIGTAEESTARETFDLMVGALAYAEHLDCTIEPDNEAMWRTVREQISNHARDVLAQFADVFAKEGSE